MAEAFQFELVSPERLLLSAKVTDVIVPGSEGEFGVGAGHSPFLSTMRPGVVKALSEDGSKHEYFVRGGFADVSASGMTVLAEQAIPMADLDAGYIAQQIQDASEDVADAKDEDARQAARLVLSQLQELQAAIKAS
ncbi:MULTISPECIES: F0F1 ATP synthase subunit epsilon [unclassified Pseudovibrio]|uniref:F0F1 ATP synthase subunit epsilon n=1 Tax=unclassified Pseudovibrio TaxID=2627060 RepID=UPI0007AE4CCA|nr:MULTISPECIES: F0F1 ATP synthase subunit epsilon [unclassified Pseudovibrio]KZL19944.1 ATP synthase epsilon chain [Pseudovibrio sp. WM33]KZL28817.1 ATP synthase epsilon chain [Pseudovibrio sp. Ad37]